MAPEAASHPRREAPGVATWVVLGVAVGFLLFVGASLWVLHAYLRLSIDQPVYLPPQPLPPPRLLEHPRDYLLTYRAEQRARLNSWAWVDRDAGLVQVPIERAMALVAARGQQAYAPLIDSRQPYRPGDSAQGSAVP